MAIKFKKRDTLFAILSDLRLNKIDNPKGLYLTEIDALYNEIEKNLLIIQSKEDKATYINGIVGVISNFEENSLHKDTFTGNKRYLHNTVVTALNKIETLRLKYGVADNYIGWFESELEKRTNKTDKLTWLNFCLHKAENALPTLYKAYGIIQTVQTTNRLHYIGQYIAYLKQRKAEFENTTSMDKDAINYTKLKWLGNQKQLAELIITLEQNNWIEKIQDGERAAICRTICELIDISGTKKSEKSNEVKSFTEIMKPDIDNKKKATYLKIFTPRLKAKFKGILPR